MKIIAKQPFFLCILTFLCSFLSSSLYKAPWARVMVYGQGHKVRRNGQLNLMEAVCYPLDASPTNTGLTPPPTTNQYPSVIIPTDKVHIKLGWYQKVLCKLHLIKWYCKKNHFLLSLFSRGVAPTWCCIGFAFLAS